MTERLEKTYALTGETNGNNAIRVCVSYNKGGYNVFSYQQERRGYYFSITPCKIERKYGCTMIETTAFSGYKMLIEEIGRNSQKAFNNAVSFMDEHKKEYLSKWFPNLETKWEEMQA